MPHGPTLTSLAATPEVLGAETRHVASEAALSRVLRQPHSANGLICDSCFASTLATWRAAHVGDGPAGKPVFILLQAEERRALRDFLGAPLAGYLLKPLRRSTLLRQLRHLVQYDGRTIATAVEDSRRAAAGEKSSRVSRCSLPRTIR